MSERRPPLLSIFASALFALNAAAAEPFAIPADVRTAFDSNCLGCHNAEKKKGSIDLSVFLDERAVVRGRKVWRKVVEQLDTKAMPPDGSDPLPEPDRAKLIAWTRKALTAGSGTPDAGPTLIRRLTRAQYDFTLRDLLGVDITISDKVGMPDDVPPDEGFDTIAAGLNVSFALLEKYFAAADIALDRVFYGDEKTKGPPNKPSESEKKRVAALAKLLIAKPDDKTKPRDAAKQILTAFARRAYRRPVKDAEIERLLPLFDKVIAKKEPFENAVRAAMKPILVSPHFLMRLESDKTPQGKETSHPVNDHELAVRLSYFLWSSMPDEPLFALAEQGKLSDPATFEKEARRMLADPRAKQLTDGFAEQWLQLKKLANARPSTEFFPTFNGKLRTAMHDETALFFEGLRTDDRSVVDLIDADYTYVNQDLAKHYNITGVNGPKMVRVALKPEHRRGGLLGMGSILALTSHTSRTSPTLRGKWILDVIFGTPPPPPPPDAGMIKEDKKNKTPKSFREQLNAHASQPSCIACHKRMDPLGFALDNYDAVGAWRDSVGGQPLDTTGTLPNGAAINGAADLKKLVLSRKQEFVHTLTEKFLSYALGRDADYYDDDVIAQIEKDLAANDYKFSALVLGIVKSHPFRHRRNAEPVSETAAAAPKTPAPVKPAETSKPAAPNPPPTPAKKEKP